MPQDAFTLRYLCEELNKILKGGKINKIIEPSLDEIVFTVYTDGKVERLYISVNPSCPRIGLSYENKDSLLTSPNFCMLLKKHLLGAEIENISLVGFDRIVKIDLLPSTEFFDSLKKTLFVELMGRYSNMVLTENGKILGGNRGINLFDNGVRPLIVGKDYVFPPVGNKKVPFDKSLIDIFDGFNGEDFALFVSENVQGVAYQTAKEIVDGYLKENSQVSGIKFFEYLNGFIYKKSSPCVYQNGEGLIDVCAIKYNIDSAKRIDFNYLYEAEDYYFKNKEKIKIFNEKKQRLISIVKTAIKKISKRLSSITSRIKDAERAEENKIKADLIISNVYRIKNGAKSCVLLNYYDDNKEMEIELDENLSPSKNAEAYYKRYNKQKRAMSVLTEQKNMAESELNYLNSVVDELEIAENVEDLNIINEELVATEYVKTAQIRNKKKTASSPYRVYETEGFRIRQGRNNVENDRVTFSSKPEDIWLHAKDYHSSHVIIESEKREVPEKIIVLAAEICAYYSKGRNGGKTEIVYTERKNVKKPPKSKLGFCTYSDFKSITVNPNSHTEFVKSE